MLVRHCLWILTAIALISIFATSIQAADLTVYVGGVNPGTINYNDVKTMLDSGPIYGVRFGTKFVPYFGAEHTLGFSSDFLFPQNIESIMEAKGIVYNSNLIFDIPMPVKHFVPYITAGVGLIHQYGDPDMPVGTGFAFNYGGGLKLPRFAGPVGFRFDIRGYTAGGFSDKVNILEMSGGVLFSFGN
jgi:hypothetical protein